MATYIFRTTETLITGYSHEVQADSPEEAQAKFYAGEIEDSWESGVSDTLGQTLNEMEAPDGTLTIFA